MANPGYVTPEPERLPTAADIQLTGYAETDAQDVAQAARWHRNRAAAIERRAFAENRELKADESRTFRTHSTEAENLNRLHETLNAEATLERQSEIEAQRRSEAAHAEVRRMTGQTGTQTGLMGAYHVGGGETYHRGPTSPSFFKDLVEARRGQWGAIERLNRNNTEVEFRALGNTGGAGGSGGEWAVPGWFLEDWVSYTRAGRVTANLFSNRPLPDGISSVNIPKVTGGSTVLPQSSQNTALSQTDITTSSISAPICTLGGKQVVSQQLLDQGVGVDQIIMKDLAADYARDLGSQSLIGSGSSGQLNGYITVATGSGSNQTWTQASPTASLFFSQLGKLQASINANRLQAPDALVMTPRRWAWFASATDTTGRPFVSPVADGGMNSLAAPGTNNIAQGHVGFVLGIPTYVDAGIPTNISSTQDAVLMFVRDDIYLYESSLKVDVHFDTYADSLSVLFRCWNYAAMVTTRYPASLGLLTGSGLTTPTFPG